MVSHNAVSFFQRRVVPKPQTALSTQDLLASKVLDQGRVGPRLRWTRLDEVYIWQAKFETLQTAYNLLLDRVPAPPEAEHQKLNPEDYQFIDYWFKHQWLSASGNCVANLSTKVENDNENDNENEDEDVEVDAERKEFQSTSPAPSVDNRRGQGRSRAGINVSMRYIQNKDGGIIDGHRAREIRIHARAIFVGFAMQGKQFTSWGDADAISRRSFYSEMVIRFEELQFCDLDWKSEQIATGTYPSWKVTWLKKQKKASLDQETGLKRSHQGSAAKKPDLKRSKALETTSMPSAPEAFITSQQPIPILNIILNTPIRPSPAIQPLGNPSLLQPNGPCYDFTINNPLGTLINSNNPATFVEQLMPQVPIHAFESRPQQALSADGAQAIIGNHLAFVQPIQNPPPPVKRPRTGTTKMRPSKTSTMPRNLCALEWAVSNPKGTTDEFSAYYDGLSREGKEKWEKLSVEAKESGKT